MRADVNAILIALEGAVEADDILFRTIHKANGRPLPPKASPERGKPNLSARLKDFAREHNAVLKSIERRKVREERLKQASSA